MKFTLVSLIIPKLSCVPMGNPNKWHISSCTLINFKVYFGNYKLFKKLNVFFKWSLSIIQCIYHLPNLQPGVDQKWPTWQQIIMHHFSEDPSIKGKQKLGGCCLFYFSQIYYFKVYLNNLDGVSFIILIWNPILLYG